MTDQFNGVNTALQTLLTALRTLPTPERVALLNRIRAELHKVSPFRDQPVDYVEWVPMTVVVANDYNPNAVAPPEMELLRLSIDADGFTQPIVTNQEDTTRMVVDGFHRNRVGREHDEINTALHGYLPIVQIRDRTQQRPERIAATIRHNRARGKHSVVKMTDIVLELKRRNWTDAKIAKNLGMDNDEVLRLSQIGGLADSFRERTFSEAWDIAEDELEGAD